MTCPVCGGNSHIIDVKKDIDVVCRKRQCYECKFFFYTEEVEVKDHKIYNKLKQEYKRALKVRQSATNK